MDLKPPRVGDVVVQIAFSGIVAGDMQQFQAFVAMWVCPKKGVTQYMAIIKMKMLSATLTFAQTHDCDITEQYVDWGNNINFIFMRDQDSPHPLNNTLIGIITSTLSSWGIKICHPLWPMLNGVITSTLSSWGIKIRRHLRTICWMG